MFEYAIVDEYDTDSEEEEATEAEASGVEPTSAAEAITTMQINGREYRVLTGDGLPAPDLRDYRVITGGTPPSTDATVNPVAIYVNHSEFASGQHPVIDANAHFVSEAPRTPAASTPLFSVPAHFSPENPPTTATAMSLLSMPEPSTSLLTTSLSPSDYEARRLISSASKGATTDLERAEEQAIDAGARLLPIHSHQTQQAQLQGTPRICPFASSSIFPSTTTDKIINQMNQLEAEVKEYNRQHTRRHLWLQFCEGTICEVEKAGDSEAWTLCVEALEIIDVQGTTNEHDFLERLWQHRPDFAIRISNAFPKLYFELSSYYMVPQLISGIDIGSCHYLGERSGPHLQILNDIWKVRLRDRVSRIPPE